MIQEEFEKNTDLLFLHRLNYLLQLIIEKIDIKIVC